MNRNFIRRNITGISIFIFAAVYGIIVLSKPAFMYNKDGSLRQFGIGIQKKDNITSMAYSYSFSHSVLFLSIVLYFSPKNVDVISYF